MSKRIIRLVSMLVLIGVIFTLIACSTGSEEPDVTTAAPVTTTKAVTTTAGGTTTSEVTTEAVETNPMAEHFTITWIGTHYDNIVEGGLDQKMLEEKYNITLEPWAIGNYNTEGLAMMLAAGDMPDISHLDKAPWNAVQLYEQGLTRSINIEMYKKHFPYYYELMLQNDPTSYIHNNIRNEDLTLSDNFYGISYVVGNRAYYNVPVARLDWLENIGYDFGDSVLTPVSLSDERYAEYSNQLSITNHIFTHDEFNDILRAFTEDDPDGNGEDDTYGGVIFNHSFRTNWADLYWGQFGVNASNANFLYEDPATGNIVPSYAFTGYRDYMEWAVNMRDQGYLRTLPDGTWTDNLFSAWMTGKVGYFFADNGYVLAAHNLDYADTQIPQSIWFNAGDKDATFVTWPVLAGPQGTEPNNKWGTRRYNLDAFTSGTYRTWLVGASVSDEKLARVFTMWNDVNTTPMSHEFWSVIRFGVEGVHYTWAGEPWNSARLVTDASKIPPHYQMYGGFLGLFSSGAPSVIGTEYAIKWSNIFYEEEWFKHYCIEPIKFWDAAYVPQDMMKAFQDDWDSFGADINAIHADFRDRHWNGQIANINTEWEQYINQLYDAGLEKIVNDYYNNDDFLYAKAPDLSWTRTTP